MRKSAHQDKRREHRMEWVWLLCRKANADQRRSSRSTPMENTLIVFCVNPLDLPDLR